MPLAKGNLTEALRVYSKSEDARLETSPLDVVVRQSRNILSWTIPLMLGTPKKTAEAAAPARTYNTVNRTLCPISEHAQVIVTVSTPSLSDVTFEIILYKQVLRVCWEIKMLEEILQDKKFLMLIGPH